MGSAQGTSTAGRKQTNSCCVLFIGRSLQMKRIAGIIILALAVTAFAPALVAQTEEHGQFQVFADYTRLHHFNNANLWGPGGQISFNLNPYIQLEGSMAYDFTRNTICCSTDTATNFTNTRLR